MIKIEAAAWIAMVAHAESKFPNECCGAMIGRADGETKSVTAAVPLENAYSGEQGAFYARLKLAGLNQAPVHLEVFAGRATAKGSGLGRRTMPEVFE